MAAPTPNNRGNCSSMNPKFWAVVPRKPKCWVQQSWERCVGQGLAGLPQRPSSQRGWWQSWAPPPGMWGHAVTHWAGLGLGEVVEELADGRSIKHSIFLPRSVVCLPLFKFPVMFLWKILWFSSYRPSAPLAKILPRYFIFWVILNGNFPLLLICNHCWYERKLLISVFFN